VLAGAAADLMTQPQLLLDAREEFNITAAEGYDCPIGPDLIPMPQ
jgi:aminobenzoyl-glutamate utilization protein B